MGYYTNFSIDIRTAITRAEAKEITAAINRVICPTIENEDDWLFSLDDYSGIEDDEKATWELIPYDEMKWYDCEEDMKEIAELIYLTISNFDANKEAVIKRVDALCAKYPLYR